MGGPRILSWIGDGGWGGGRIGTVRRVWICCYGYFFLSFIFARHTNCTRTFGDEVIMPFENENHFCGEKSGECKEIRTTEGILNFFQKTFDDKLTVLSEIHAKFLIFFSVLIYINQGDSRIMRKLFKGISDIS